MEVLGAGKAALKVEQTKCCTFLSSNQYDLFTSLCIGNSPTSCSVSLNRLFRLQLYAPSKSWLISKTIRPFWRLRKVVVTRFSCSLSGRPGLRTQNWPLSPKVFSRHWRVILFCDRPMYATVTDCAVTSVGNWETATNSRERIQIATMLYFNRQQRESPHWANKYRALNAFTHMDVVGVHRNYARSY